MTGVELVSDRATKTPLDAETMGRINAAILDSGTMVRMLGNTVAMSPPLVITEAEVNTILASLDTALASV